MKRNTFGSWRREPLARASVREQADPEELDMTMAELRRDTLKFVKKMLPDAGEIDIKKATDKIVKNLAYLTED